MYSNPLAYLAQESPWCKVGFTAYLAVSGLVIIEVKLFLYPSIKGVGVRLLV